MASKHHALLEAARAELARHQDDHRAATARHHGLLANGNHAGLTVDSVRRQLEDLDTKIADTKARIAQHERNLQPEHWRGVLAAAKAKATALAEQQSQLQAEIEAAAAELQELTTA